MARGVWVSGQAGPESYMQRCIGTEVNLCVEITGQQNKNGKSLFFSVFFFLAGEISAKLLTTLLSGSLRNCE